MSEALVVGSGPNGLACALVLARAGLRVSVLEAAERIGGGTRTSELTLPGLLHDECSAVHPMAVASPLLRSLESEGQRIEWCWPEVDLAHPLGGADGAVLVRSLEATVAELGGDGAAWRRLFAPLASSFDELAEDLLRPPLHVPRHPLRLARFGLRAGLPATVLARAFSGQRARALFGGVAAHALTSLRQPLSAAIGVALIAAAHAHGWPVARGGSQAISDALAAALAVHGARIETGVRVRSLEELSSADVVALDLAPAAICELAGDRLPGRIRRAYLRYRHGPAAYKLDLAVEGGVPWRNEACRRAGTVHVAGSFGELVAAEREVARGRMPERPMVLVAQQHVADPSRSAGDVHPVWAYAHVPNGYDGDATELVLAQIERFAPGLRERIVATHARSPAQLEADNPNYVGGDIVGGANTPAQILLRPRVTRCPYSTGIPGVYICSAATPPGGGVHGMCGVGAAQAALRFLGR